MYRADGRSRSRIEETVMLEKTKERNKRKSRPNQWTGYKPRVTPTRRELEVRNRNKYKDRQDNE